MVVADLAGMTTLAAAPQEFLDLLRSRHATIMGGRRDIQGGHAQSSGISARSSPASATDASISALRIDTLSTVKPNGMPSRRQNAIRSRALARQCADDSASVSAAFRSSFSSHRGTSTPSHLRKASVFTDPHTDNVNSTGRGAGRLVTRVYQVPAATGVSSDVSSRYRAFVVVVVPTTAGCGQRNNHHTRHRGGGPVVLLGRCIRVNSAMRHRTVNAWSLLCRVAESSLAGTPAEGHAAEGHGRLRSWRTTATLGRRPIAWR